MLPEVTVGLPVYNGERYLRQTLECILQQDYPALRLLISDNHSSDGTEAICREFADRYPAVRYVRQPQNLGAVRNFEFVLRACDTEYLVWMGDHDLWGPGYVSLLVDALQRHPAAVVAYGPVAQISAAGDVMNPDYTPDTWSATGTVLERYRTFAWKRKACLMLYGAIRVAAARGLAFPQILGFDNVVLADLALRGDFVFVPGATFVYREFHEHESVEGMWQRQQVALAPTTRISPWWGVFLETVRMVLRSRALSWRQKIGVLDETIWTYQMRFGDTLRSENARWATWLFWTNRVLAHFRGARAPAW